MLSIAMLWVSHHIIYIINALAYHLYLYAELLCNPARLMVAAAILFVQLQKGEVKLRAITSTPWSIIVLTARVLSAPPDNNATAFLFNSIAPFQHIELIITYHLPVSQQAEGVLLFLAISISILGFRQADIVSRHEEKPFILDNCNTNSNVI